MVETTGVKMNTDTLKQYDAVVRECRHLFVRKMHDYGTAWRILRISSITDQVYIKAQRIRSIEEKGRQKVQEGIRAEFVGIVNYSLIALIQLEIQSQQMADPGQEQIMQMFDEQAMGARQLMADKNHDYGEAWRNMRVSSFTDLILMKLMRVRQIEDNEGATLVSEGIAANFQDIINYAIFALIRLEELDNIS